MAPAHPARCVSNRNGPDLRSERPGPSGCRAVPSLRRRLAHRRRGRLSQEGDRTTAGDPATPGSVARDHRADGSFKPCSWKDSRADGRMLPPDPGKRQPRRGMIRRQKPWLVRYSSTERTLYGNSATDSLIAERTISSRISSYSCTSRFRNQAAGERDSAFSYERSAGFRADPGARPTPKKRVTRVHGTSLLSMV